MTLGVEICGAYHYVGNVEPSFVKAGHILSVDISWLMLDPSGLLREGFSKRHSLV